MICNYTGPEKVEISPHKVKNFNERYGIQGFSWYPISTNSIKYFDGKAWGYKTI